MLENILFMQFNSSVIRDTASTKHHKVNKTIHKKYKEQFCPPQVTTEATWVLAHSAHAHTHARTSAQDIQQEDIIYLGESIPKLPLGNSN